MNSSKPTRQRPGRQHVRTLWSLAVLSLLRERDMHPYQLQRDGLIESVETTRAGRWPERTVYRLTADGDEELLIWLRDLLSEPVREPSQFTAALAHVAHLTPQDALQQLQ